MAGGLPLQARRPGGSLVGAARVARGPRAGLHVSLRVGPIKGTLEGRAWVGAERLLPKNGKILCTFTARGQARDAYARSLVPDEVRDFGSTPRRRATPLFLLGPWPKSFSKRSAHLLSGLAPDEVRAFGSPQRYVYVYVYVCVYIYIHTYTLTYTYTRT